MGRRKLNLVRWSVHTIPEVKAALEAQAMEHRSSLAVEAGLLLEVILRQQGLLPPLPEADRPANSGSARGA
jgi:hypothetical protein